MTIHYVKKQKKEYVINILWQICFGDYHKTIIKPTLLITNELETKIVKISIIFTIELVKDQIVNMTMLF